MGDWLRDYADKRNDLGRKSGSNTMQAKVSEFTNPSLRPFDDRVQAIRDAPLGLERISLRSEPHK